MIKINGSQVEGVDKILRVESSLDILLDKLSRLKTSAQNTRFNASTFDVSD